MPKHLATPSPKIDEVKKAIEQTNLRLEVIPAAARPNAPWRKTGFVFVAKEGPKTQTLYKVARELQRLHAET